jgi:PAS domain S-box-containing protein
LSLGRSPDDVAPPGPGLDPSTLAAIIRSSNDAIVTKTLDGIVTSWNPAAERIFGYTPAEIIGRPITVLFPPDRLSEEDEFQRLLRAGRRIDHFETVRVRKNGGVIDVSVTLSPITTADGRIVGISKIARDITGQKAAEARVRARERLLHITLASIGDAVVTTDERGRITFLNAVAERLTAWPAAEAIGRDFRDVMRLENERTGRPAESPVERVLREGLVVGLANHTILVARNGTRLPIDDRAAPIQDDEGRLFGTVMVFHDITERRLGQQSLQRLAALVESSDDAIVSKTLAGVVTSWNAAAERMFGYGAAEMIGRPITVLFPPDRLAEEEMFLALIGRGERVSHYETVRVRKDGQPISVSVTLSPIRDEHGLVVGASKIARDITEQARLREREHEARRQAEETNRLKDEFLSTLSHELRTPLNSIFGWVRLMQAGAVELGRQAHALNVIERNCRAQMALISDLLDMSRAAAGQVRLELRAVDLADVARAVLDGIRPTASAKTITLDLAADPDHPRVRGDIERLHQIVWNLVNNAVKFTDPGGRVEVRVHRRDASVVLTVTDTGIGIAPDVVPHVFERFRQADSTSTRRHGGLGLGLTIVRELVRLHGGEVRAESGGPGRGATFVVELPLAVEDAKAG